MMMKILLVVAFVMKKEKSITIPIVSVENAVITTNAYAKLQNFLVSLERMVLLVNIQVHLLEVFLDQIHQLVAVRVLVVQLMVILVITVKLILNV